jgi:hypothetical protein
MECLSPPSTGTKESFGGNGRPLSRSSSIKSTNSLASNGTGASSSKKRIVPLYNLNFHVRRRLSSCLLSNLKGELY